MISMALWNRLVTFSVIIPLLYGIVHRKAIKEAAPILTILVITLGFEFVTTLAIEVIKSPIANSSVFYHSFEIVFFTLFVTNSIDKKYKKPSFIIAGMLIILWVSLYFFYKTPINIVYGTCMLFEIILSSIYMLNNTRNILNNWRFTLVFAFFQYSILAVGILSIVDFVATHQQYLNIFFAIHSTANLLLYLFILIGFIQCKRQLSKM